MSMSSGKFAIFYFYCLNVLIEDFDKVCMLLPCRLSNCTRFLSFVGHHLRIFGENQNYLIQQCSNLNNLTDVVLQKHLKIFLLLL